MSLWRTNTWLRLKALLHRRAFDRDLEEEINFHIAMRERKHQRLMVVRQKRTGRSTAARSSTASAIET